MNMYQAVAPRDLARRNVAAMSAWFRRVNEELMMNSIPAARNSSAARTAPSKAPGWARKLSCTAAVEPSSDSDTIRMPDALIRSHTAVSTRVPLVARHMRRPRSVPCRARSKRSGRSSGSPPDRTSTAGW